MSSFLTHSSPFTNIESFLLEFCKLVLKGSSMVSVGFLGGVLLLPSGDSEAPDKLLIGLFGDVDFLLYIPVLSATLWLLFVLLLGEAEDFLLCPVITEFPKLLLLEV